MHQPISFILFGCILSPVVCGFRICRHFVFSKYYLFARFHSTNKSSKEQRPIFLKMVDFLRPWQSVEKVKQENRRIYQLTHIKIFIAQCFTAASAYDALVLASILSILLNINLALANISQLASYKQSLINNKNINMIPSSLQLELLCVMFGMYLSQYTVYSVVQEYILLLMIIAEKAMGGLRI